MGKKMLSKQSYNITNTVEQDNKVVVEADWSGTIANDIGMNFFLFLNFLYIFLLFLLFFFIFYFIFLFFLLISKKVHLNPIKN